MAQQEDIEIDKGADFAMELHLATPSGSAKNLTGFTVTSQLRRTVSASDSDAITFTSTIVDPPTRGVVVLSLTNAQTGAMDPGRYLYDVELSSFDSDSSSLVERVLQGQAIVTPEITRSN